MDQVKMSTKVKMIMMSDSLIEGAVGGLSEDFLSVYQMSVFFLYLVLGLFQGT